MTGLLFARRPADAIVITILLGTGCASPVRPAPSPGTASCVVVEDEARPHITFGLVTEAGRARPDEPPHQAAAQIIEMLVRVDCSGAVVAGLADRWSSDDDRTWRFRIARGSHFHDGTPVTAPAIVAAWGASRTAAPLLASVTATGDDALEVSLHASASAHAFALHSLAVVRQPSGSGTGPFVPTAANLRIVSRAPAPETPDTIDFLTFRAPRPALDRGVDVLITADAAAVAYARALPAYRVTPLHWTRTYVLATASGSATAAPSADALAALARAAAAADARAALPPFWWDACSAPARPVPPSRTGDIVYTRGDEVARNLAERITALAWPRERAPAWLRALLPAGYPAPRAVPVTDAVDNTAHAAGPLAVVAALPRVSYAPCAGPASERPAPLVSAGWNVTALLDTRDYLIHRAGIGRIVLDGDGTIRFSPR